MHCVAGDGVGILAGAVLSSVLGLAGPLEAIVEYVLGFAFGWTIFQALFMRDMVGGSYQRALTSTFVPELLSMNVLMAGMLPTVMTLRRLVPAADNPMTPGFWFVMSMGLLVGFVVAYPMNWWLVANHLKHGMTTVRPKVMPAAAPAGAHDPATHAAMSGMAHAGPQGSVMAMEMNAKRAPWPPVPVMAVVSFVALVAGAAIALLPWGS